MRVQFPTNAQRHKVEFHGRDAGEIGRNKTGGAFSRSGDKFDAGGGTGGTLVKTVTLFVGKAGGFGSAGASFVIRGDGFVGTIILLLTTVATLVEAMEMF